MIPAAGASSRMRGADKLLKQVGGRALLRRQAEEALRAANHVTVTLPDHDHPRAAALAGLPVQLVAVPDASSGMSASLRRGVGMLPRGIDALIVLPADMPELTADDILKLVQGFRAMPQPTLQQGCAEDGTPGHPVLFPADCFSAFQMLDGDAGARSVLASNRNRLRRVPLPGRRALIDLDTPEAWRDWEQRQEALDPC
ncbi:nucleotidyltransferase family protein [Alloyangia pacifica]|uniref:nucleotidyltransferase family protein n=1 Tax=Alloyangia pacifica TaxID=311180 RepID=UPI00299E3EF1|nr:nucleotidyltransferase family protein [Alloyangia pacifica]